MTTIGRGTTPTNYFDVDVDLTDAVTIFITYQQSGITVVEKSIDDIEVTPERLFVNLTQRETLRFAQVGKIKMQIRAGFADDSRLISNIMTAPVEKILKEGVI